jgi:DNA repair protein RAD50
MNISANCERCQREIEALDDKIKSTSQQISQLQDNLIELDKEEDKAKAFERNITDNIRYRTYISEIQELEEKISQIDVEKAKEACRKFDAEYDTAEKCLAKLKSEVSPAFIFML